MTQRPGFDVEDLRSRFPALSRREGAFRAAYLDGPGGTQVPRSVIEAMSDVLDRGVSNLEGGFGASRAADLAAADARQAMADLLNAYPAEISFGQNMTSLTFAMSRALARTWNAGDVIVLTSLDHDANFTPWVNAAEDSGVEIRVADFDVKTGRLDPAAVIDLLDERVRLVAVCLASNALGSVVDIAPISRAAHEVGALLFVDAVHATPHRLIDVQDLGCDFLVCSAYKFFGPHTGILYGRLDQMAELEPYKVRPAPTDPPGKWETGTQSFESLAGVTAAVDYLASLGSGEDRRSRLQSGYRAIAEHEEELGNRFVKGVADLDQVTIYGPPETSEDRVTTFAIDIDGYEPSAVAGHLINAGIYVWSGHYYAVNVMERLGFLDRGGLVRIGFVHYNTHDEVDRVLEVLGGLESL